MSKTDILIFNVGLGQSIFVYPHEHPNSSMLVDCGHFGAFHPIDFLKKSGYIKNNELPNLTLTNFDEDHFSSLPYIIDKLHIRSISFSSNLTTSEIRELKKEYTEAFHQVCRLKDSYTQRSKGFQTPYTKATFYLDKKHLRTHDTNNLSQLIFIDHFDTVLCITGDLENEGWEAMLRHKPDVKAWLTRTKIFIASHHGRNNGYHSEVFQYCRPECIIISDKSVVHGTQENMSTIYGTHTLDTGIVFNDDFLNKRKVLTTRSDGHILIQLQPNGIRQYKKVIHD